MNGHDRRSRPHVAIPAGASSPTNQSTTAHTFSSAQTPWAFELAPPAYNNDRDRDYDVTAGLTGRAGQLAEPWDGVRLSSPNFPVPHLPGQVPTRPPSYASRPYTAAADTAPLHHTSGHGATSVPGLSRSTTVTTSGGGTSNVGVLAFPEPQLFRSTSQRVGASAGSMLHPPAHGHSRSKSDLAGRENTEHSSRLRREPSTSSFGSTASSYRTEISQDEDDAEYAQAAVPHAEAEDLSNELSKLSLDSFQNLELFQKGELPEKDQEWHKLVPPEARDALGKHEVRRQSVLFEVFKSEREYVADLEAVQEVFIEGLRNADPPIIREKAGRESFIKDVFGNLGEILGHHQRMLASLFARQREQHPLVQSISDIVLEMVLNPDFRDAYTTYIKHYPLSESYHRHELKSNKAYADFIYSITSGSSTSVGTNSTTSTSQTQAPPSSHLATIRKRDLITFLSRPVTRLPRLNLLLSTILQVTQSDESYVFTDHPDLQMLPLILGIVGDSVKEAQPGIEAAEGKVKFSELKESMVGRAGEIGDMDFDDESRTLVYQGPVSRRQRLDTGFSGWVDLNLSLLDNYLLLTKEAKSPNGVTKHLLVSRPLSLFYLRLGSFDSPPETRREKADDSGGIFDSLRRVDVPLYPFTIYHASAKSTRRYTLYVTTEALRNKWKNFLVDTLAVNRARAEGSMWFVPRTISGQFFNTLPTNGVASSRFLTGKITCAVPFTSGGRKFIAVGCAAGIYVSLKGEENFRKVLPHASPTSMAAIQSIGDKTYNKFLVHHDTSLFSYSLDMLARSALGHVKQSVLEASLERIAGSESSAGTGNVQFFRHAKVGHRILVVYASKKTLAVSLNLNVLEVLDITQVASITAHKRTGSAGAPLSFRLLGEPGYVPRDAYDITTLVKTIGICTHVGIVVADPTNLAKSAVTIVPDFSGANSTTNKPMADLHTKTQEAIPLGMIKCSDGELLVVYDTMGCYITKQGIPSRQSAYVKWETPATSFTHRGPHILLFSTNFIEIREIMTTRIVQVIEGSDLMLLYSGQKEWGEDESILVRTGKEIEEGMEAQRTSSLEGVQRIIELNETVEIKTAPPLSSVPAMWEEWDMS